MIRIRALNGPYANQIREIPSNQNPAALLRGFVQNGWGWEIDFSQANRDEVIAWGGADLIARAVRAVQNGRPAIFLGVTYTTMEDLQGFEDAIVGSGYEVKIMSDDHKGLVIITSNPE